MMSREEKNAKKRKKWRENPELRAKQREYAKKYLLKRLKDPDFAEAERENHRKNTAKYRAIDKANGICLTGGCHSRARKNRVLCLQHAKQNRKASRERRVRLRAEGKCGSFGCPNSPAVKGGVYCIEHHRKSGERFKKRLAESPEFRERMRQQSRQWRTKRMKDPANREADLKRTREWRHKNRDKLRARRLHRMETDPEYREKQRYVSTPKSRARSRERYRTEPEFRAKKIAAARVTVAAAKKKRLETDSEFRAKATRLEKIKREGKKRRSRCQH